MRLTGRKILAALGVIAVLSIVLLEFNSYSRTDGGTVMVIRNDGPLDDTKIRQVLPINSPRERTGWFSTEHPYFAQGRYYWTTGDPGGGDAPGSVDVWLKTADGVFVGAVGQLQFTLDTRQTDPITKAELTYNPAEPFTLQPDGVTYKPNLMPRAQGGISLLEAFDNKFGTRQYPVADNPGTEDKESGQAAPWEGDTGWNAWLDSQARPQILGAFNQVIGGTKCVTINPSCALVVQSTQAEWDAAATAAASGQPIAAPDNTALLREFEKRVADALTVNMTRNMGGPFFTNITYSVTKIPLDPNVEKQIAAAQTKYAETSAAIAQGQKDQADATARYNVAKTDADANLEKQRGYNGCSDCAQQDMQKLVNEGYKNLPPNLTTLAGNGVGVQLQR
jgi:hypothetical protein